MDQAPVNLVALFESAIRNNHDLKAFTDYGGESYTYGQVGERIRAIHRLLDESGVRRGDRVALLGKNSS